MLGNGEDDEDGVIYISVFRDPATAPQEKSLASVSEPVDLRAAAIQHQRWLVDGTHSVLARRNPLRGSDRWVAIVLSGRQRHRLIQRPSDERSMIVFHDDGCVDVSIEGHQHVLLRILAQPLESVDSCSTQSAGGVDEAGVYGRNGIADGVGQRSALAAHDGIATVSAIQAPGGPRCTPSDVLQVGLCVDDGLRLA